VKALWPDPVPPYPLLAPAEYAGFEEESVVESGGGRGGRDEAWLKPGGGGCDMMNGEFDQDNRVCVRRIT
jgi:hypothetical protein